MCKTDILTLTALAVLWLILSGLMNISHASAFNAGGNDEDYQRDKQYRRWSI